MGASIPLGSGPNAAEVCVEDLEGARLVSGLVETQLMPGGKEMIR